MSEIINWLRSRSDVHNVVFIYSYGGHTLDWSNVEAIEAAEAGEGADALDELGWKKSGNPIHESDKQVWMEAISEVFDGREYAPYEWKQIIHPQDSTITIDYLSDMDDDTWFAIFTYQEGNRKEYQTYTKHQMMDKLEEAFPASS